jgi:hypothetical protein
LSRPVAPGGSFNDVAIPENTTLRDYIRTVLDDSLSEKVDNTAERGGFWSDIDAAAPKVARLRDRVFVGGAAVSTTTRAGSANGTWMSGANAPAWGVRDGQFVVLSDVGGLAVVGASRLSDHYASLKAVAGQTPAAIGVSGFVINDGDIEKPAWAMYSDIQHEPVGGLAQSYGIEIAAKNKGPDYTSNPYQLTWGVYGIWLAGGGHAAYGGAPTNPSNTAIAVLKNDHTWNKGIVFSADALTGTNGNDSGAATAIEMAKNHQIRWSKPDGTPGAVIRSGVASANKSLTLLFLDDQVKFGGPSLAGLFDLIHATGAVNSLEVRNAITGQAPSITARGSDSNVNLTMTPKGTGALVVNGVREFSDDATAATGGVPVGGVYRTGSALKIRVS